MRRTLADLLAWLAAWVVTLYVVLALILLVAAVLGVQVPLHPRPADPYLAVLLAAAPLVCALLYLLLYRPER
jgi:hypothetical protein